MVWVHRGIQIPLSIYHGVPKGWARDEIIALHKALGGTFSIDGPVASEPGAHPWMPDRHNWLQYRETLYRVANGIRQGDLACAELGVRFIELRYIGSYSGFIRQRLARALKSAALTTNQCLRLHDHFRSLVLADERTQEYREFVPLWLRVADARQLANVIADLKKLHNGNARAIWWEPRLRPNKSFKPTLLRGSNCVHALR